jgi:transposase-like protein
MKCDRCESTELRKAGIQLQSGKNVQRYQCKKCGKIVLGEEIK